MKYKTKKKAINFSVIFVFIPFIYLSMYFLYGEPEPDHKYYKERFIDKFKVILFEENTKAPYTIFNGTKMKDYGVEFNIEDLEHFRIINLQVSKEVPKISLIEGLVHGSPYELDAHVPFPKTIDEDDKLWLIIEKWDGKIIHISWPLKEVISTTN